MKIYFDTCCFSRPYDDQTDTVVFLESEAILSIMELCKANSEWEFCAGAVLATETGQNPDIEKRAKVFSLYGLAEGNIELNAEIIARAKYLEQFSIGSFDALHAASAEYAKADVLLTTDGDFLRKIKRSDLCIRVENPVVWLLEVANEK